MMINLYFGEVVVARRFFFPQLGDYMRPQTLCIIHQREMTVDLEKGSKITPTNFPHAILVVKRICSEIET